MRRHFHCLLLASSLAVSFGGPTLANAEPLHVREAPPPLREERVAPRHGFVFIRGHWDWRGKWEWVPGRWEAERAGKHFREHRWEKRGDEWVYVDGAWVDLGPRVAPPPLREERIVARPGFVWVKGRWDWRNNNWAWVEGRYERERPNFRWNEGRWEQRDGEWVWVEGAWVSSYPEFPTSPPPPPQVEHPEPRPGAFFIPGHYVWKEGRYVWTPGVYENHVHGKHFVPGQWIYRDNKWLWTNGAWVNN